VGPESAGARPGPACYGHGGTEATVTDANLVLGRINPRYFLGGELELDMEAARAVIQRNVAEPYGMTCEEAAEGVITVLNSNMSRLLWEVMIGRGYDPRDFSLLAFGGAGPLHACELAGSLGVGEVSVPGEPGVFSAFGILMADARHDYERMLVDVGLSIEPAELESAFTELEDAGRAQIEAEHAGYAQVEAIRSAELRYAGQDHPLSVELPARGDSADALAAARERFHEKHDRLYGFRRSDTPVELVRIQVSVVGRIERHQAVATTDPPRAVAEPKGTRELYLEGAFRPCPTYDRAELSAGSALTGPAVVEERGSTTYVPPGFELTAPGDGTLRITGGAG
ncbi:MAG: hydantoinase/oxoprolinase family protein, partial [Gaiellaceae bacterium]